MGPPFPCWIAWPRIWASRECPVGHGARRSRPASESEESPTLTRLSRPSPAGGPRGNRARETLIRSLKGIEIDLRHPDVIEQALPRDHWLVSALSDEASRTDPMLISLPQIHRRDDGGVYPQLAHELAVACGDVLLRTACAYLDDGSGRAPAHYRSLGECLSRRRSSPTRSSTGSLRATISFCRYRRSTLRPHREVRCRRRTRASGVPLSAAYDRSRRREAPSLQTGLCEARGPPSERLFSDKRHEIDAQLTMLATRNTPSFRSASLFLYGSVPDNLLEDARRVLSLPKARTSKIIMWEQTRSPPAPAS